MPTCPTCRVAYLDGETHVCTQERLRSLRRSKLLLWAGAAVVGASNYFWFKLIAWLLATGPTSDTDAVVMATLPPLVVSGVGLALIAASRRSALRK